MAWLFSKRCRYALKDGKIKVSIPTPVRIRIWKQLENFNLTWWENDETGFAYQVTALEQLPSKMQEEIGCKQLLAYPEDGKSPPMPASLKDFVLRGNYPPFIFDILEIYYEWVEKENKQNFQNRINEIMEESSLPWRMAEGKIYPIDSAYIDEEILRKAHKHLNDPIYQGAATEFDKAREDLLNGDYEGAIQNANLAVESVIKVILKKEKGKPGELLQELITSGIIPEYHKGFLQAFRDHILRCVANMRNEEPSAGHGRGPQTRQVPPPLAELGVHMSAVLINYLVKQNSDQHIVIDDDIPF
jgi:hypothetical protein